jgi:hypothetical protein
MSDLCIYGVTMEMVCMCVNIITKGVIRIRNSKDRQHNGQKKKDKQRSTKHYTEN